jgi:hypothetical protein
MVIRRAFWPRQVCKIKGEIKIKGKLGSQSAAQARRCRSPRDVAGPKAMCSVAKSYTLFELGDWSSKIVCRKLRCCDVLMGVTLGSRCQTHSQVLRPHSHSKICVLLWCLLSSARGVLGQ